MKSEAKIFSPDGIGQQLGPLAKDPSAAQVILLAISNANDLALHHQLMSQFAAKCVVLSSLSNDENLQLILAQYPINYLLFTHSPSLEMELSLAIASLTNHFTAEIDAWLAPGEKLLTQEIWEKNDIMKIREQQLQYLDFGAFFQSPLQYVDGIINELVTNAIFNAPRGPDQLPRYRHLSRQANVQLSPTEKVVLEIFSINKNILITVEDGLGGLDYPLFRSALVRAAQTQAPLAEGEGAGIGLYLVYRYSNLLLIENRPQQRTKIYALIEATKKFKQYQGRITSLLFPLFQGVST